MCLSLVTWAALADAAKVGEWKSIIDVVFTLFLALAALTRHRRSASIFRLLTGGWIASTPYLVGIGDREPTAPILTPIAGARVRARRKWPVSGESGRVHDPIATRPKHDLQRDR